MYGCFSSIATGVLQSSLYFLCNNKNCIHMLAKAIFAPCTCAHTRTLHLPNQERIVSHTIARHTHTRACIALPNCSICTSKNPHISYPVTAIHGLPFDNATISAVILASPRLHCQIKSERFKCVMPRILFLHPNFCMVNVLKHSHMIFI